MVPFTAGINESEALAWAAQQRESSLRGGGAGVVMHLVREPIGTLWVIADHERERFTTMTGHEPKIIRSVPEGPAPATSP